MQAFREFESHPIRQKASRTKGFKATSGLYLPKNSPTARHQSQVLNSAQPWEANSREALPLSESQAGELGSGRDCKATPHGEFEANVQRAGQQARIAKSQAFNLMTLARHVELLEQSNPKPDSQRVKK